MDKELNIKRYGDNIPILPLTNTVEIYKYSDAILKHMERDALKTFQNDLLYSNNKVSLPTGEDQQKHYTTQPTDADKITDDYHDKFCDKLQNEYYYMIPLRLR